MQTQPELVQSRIRRIGGRLGAGIASQAVSSASNLIISVVAARHLGVAAFGAFALAALLQMLLVGLQRALIGEAILVSGASREIASSAIASTLTFAVLSSASLGISAIATSGDVRMVMLALAVTLTFPAVLDTGRYLAFAANDARGALRLDLNWAAVQAVAVLGLFQLGDLPAWAFTAAWNGSAIAATACVLRRVRIHAPHIGWIRKNWTLSWRYTVEWVVGAGAAHASVILLGWVAAIEAVGAVRAAQVVFGPVNVLFAGTLSVLVPAGRGLGIAQLRHAMAAASTGLSCAAVCITAAATLTPTGLGQQLLGENWSAAAPLFLAVGLSTAMNGVAAGGVAGLRALRAAAHSMRTRILIAPIILVVPLAGAALEGASGFAWGAAATSFVGALAWQRSFWRATAS